MRTPILYLLGASLDGIYDEKCVEIKCPQILAYEKPDNLESLTKQQQKSFCCEKINNTLVLKKSHAYYYQTQIQMMVTGYVETLFVI